MLRATSGGVYRRIRALNALGSGGGATALPQSGAIVERWSADTITPQADGSTVTSWTGVNGIVAGTPPFGSLPTYKTNVFGTKPAVRFAGSNFLSAGTGNAVTNALDTQIFTALVVFRNLGATPGAGAMVGAGTGGGAFNLAADGVSVGQYGGVSGSWVPNAAQTGFSTVGISSTTSDMNVPSNSGLRRYYARNTCFGSFTSPVNATGGGPLLMGTFVNQFVACNCDIVDIVFWNVQLTPSEYIQAEKWACDKYAQAYPWAAKPSYTVFPGDSITAGVGITGDADKTYPYIAAQTLGLALGQWSNLGIGSIKYSGMQLNAAGDFLNTYAIMGKPIRAGAFEWYNEFINGRLYPNSKDDALAYLASIRNANVKVCFGTSTSFSGDPSAERNQYNAYFDANHTVATMDAYVAIHADLNIGAPTAYAAFPANWFDAVHLSNTGYPFLAAVMAAGVATI